MYVYHAPITDALNKLEQLLQALSNPDQGLFCNPDVKVCPDRRFDPAILPAQRFIRTAPVPILQPVLAAPATLDVDRRHPCTDDVLNGFGRIDVQVDPGLLRHE